MDPPFWVVATHENSPSAKRESHKSVTTANLPGKNFMRTPTNPSFTFNTIESFATPTTTRGALPVLLDDTVPRNNDAFWKKKAILVLNGTN